MPDTELTFPKSIKSMARSRVMVFQGVGCAAREHAPRSWCDSRHHRTFLVLGDDASLAEFEKTYHRPLKGPVLI